MSLEFISLDIEATGMDPARHEIIEIGIVLADLDRDIRSYNSLIRPRGRVPLGAAKLTGIDPDELRDAPTIDEITPFITGFARDRMIVGHSVQFDLAMLSAFGVHLPGTVIDTYHLATIVLPDLPDYSLGTVARALGIELSGSHRALYDATMNAEVFRRLVAQLLRHDPHTLEQVAVHARGAGWPFAPLLVKLAKETVARLADDDRADMFRGTHELAFLTPRERPEPLEPTGSHRPVPVEALRHALGAEGEVSRVLPNYEHRPQQLAMAEAVAQAFNENRELLVEAGTGTGKSLAYLLPAALHAQEKGETVVISTNTLALQDQLMRKDIPTLRRVLASLPADLAPQHAEAPVEAVALKGRTNYLCLRRWFAAQHQPTFDEAESSLRAKVTLWLAQTETGDRAELRLDGAEEAAWRQVAAEETACNPARCVFNQRNQCFLFRARRAAEAAHLVVANHALLLTDSLAGNRVLPDFHRLIIDEAHHLEDQATTQYGFSVAERDVTSFLDAVIRSDAVVQAGAAMGAASYLSRPALTATESGRQRAGAALERVRQLLTLSQTARTALHTFFVSLGAVMQGSARGTDRSLRLTERVREGQAWDDVLTHWSVLEHALRETEGHLRWFSDALAQNEPENDDDEDAVQSWDIAAADVVSAQRQGQEVMSRISEIVSEPDHDRVYWLEKFGPNEVLSLHAAPLRVNELLHDRIFGHMATTVLTSATITTDGTFAYTADHLGLDRPTELIVPSPFDYLSSTLLYLADDMPEPQNPGYQKQLQETLVSTCAETGGRALVLFTSYSSLQATYRAIKRPLEERGVVVLAQRLDGSPRQLVDRLKNGDRVVVLGTASFWEGIDVVGPALSLLVITKLPFAVPSDPVFAARGELIAETGGDAFLDYAVPQAVLRFKQGFGRLIRSGNDRGVCAVLDRRILTKRYGQSFVDSLPECSVIVGSSRDLPMAAADWIDGVPNPMLQTF